MDRRTRPHPSAQTAARSRASGRLGLAWLGGLVVALAGGCSAEAQECTSGADCPSGACRGDGTCVPVGSTGGEAGSGGSGGGSGGSGGVAASGGTGGAGLCQPNGDGSIERAELPLQAGLNAKFLTAQDATVSTAGITHPDGSRSWDFTVSLPDDHLSLVETLPLGGLWFGSLFPGASYAARLSDESDLLGVFEIAPDGLLLRGVVSPDDGLYRTELTYDPAVRVLDFPLAEGKNWQSSASVSGLAVGVMTWYSEAYDYQVDAHGDAATPFATFPVLRVRSTLTRTVGLLDTVVRSHLFVAECFGTVAAVSSEDNEPNGEFEAAREVRRLSP